MFDDGYYFQLMLNDGFSELVKRWLLIEQTLRTVTPHDFQRGHGLLVETTGR